MKVSIKPVFNNNFPEKTISLPPAVKKTDYENQMNENLLTTYGFACISV